VDVTAGRHRLMLVAVGILALVALAGGLLLWPRGDIARPATAGQQDGTRLVKATLTRIQTVPCEAPDPAAPLATCIKVQARLADGGRRVNFETTDPTGDTFGAGQDVTQPTPTTSKTLSAPAPCWPWRRCSSWR
jgi:hypothetical protein